MIIKIKTKEGAGVCVCTLRRWGCHPFMEQSQCPREALYQTVNEHLASIQPVEAALPVPDLRAKKVGMRRTNTGLTSASHSVRGGARMETWPDAPTQFTETLSVSPCTRARVCVCVHNCVRFCNYIDCNPPGSSVHGILQARILEWVAISSSRGSS